MCGIAGLFDTRRRDRNPAASALAMADALAHRGPDGRDSWGDPAIGIGLGHRRLAIVDLSPTGAQPMTSADGRYVISYNGEVYNFPELRDELIARGHHFRGASDTEVMLAAFVEWGVAAATSRFAGMFAFAVFDRSMGTLHLVRDRMGVKPLYWAIADGYLLFGSELRALMVHPAFRKDVDPAAVDAVTRYSYVPAPRTIFRGVWKLPPGSILTADGNREPVVSRYWAIEDAIAMPAPATDPHAAIDGLDRTLRQAVRGRMIADVPLGAFLSGGLDSSTVVAVMQALSDRPVRTYTVGFQHATYDESKDARAVARHLGTEHTEITLRAPDALALVDSIADWFDEPFADSSQLPTYLVSRMTRRYVTVALSGDGGDEVFGGYPKYPSLERLWRRIGWLPHPVRAAMSRLPAAAPERWLQKAAALLDPGRAERIGEKTRRIADAIGAPDFDRACAALATVGIAEAGLVNGVTEPIGLAPPPENARWKSDLTLRMQARDLVTYLPDDILTKVDRCSMAVSLEAREPLLDHRLIEYVWSLPAHIRRGDGRPKTLLRQLVDRYIPRELLDRPKRGFSIPLDDWLRGPLRDWAEELLSPSALARDGLFDIAQVRGIWSRHLSGEQRNATGLWNVLMLRAWSERWFLRATSNSAMSSAVRISA